MEHTVLLFALLCLVMYANVDASALPSFPWQKVPEASDWQKKSVFTEGIQLLGSLEQPNVVGIAAHPSASGKLLYADETTIYEFDASTRRSRRLAGSPTVGLSSYRTSVDGRALQARFVYITKLIVRSGKVFVFDNDRLRELNMRSLVVRTVAVLSDEVRNPVTGTVSWDLSSVYWFSSAGTGHFVMKMSLANPVMSDAEFITGGGSLIAYADISPDGKYLYLADVDTNTIQKIGTADGSMSIIRTQGSDSEFTPGPVLAKANGDVLVVNSARRTIEVVSEVGNLPSTALPLCSQPCLTQLSNPQDVAVNRNGDIYVLDAMFHERLPTYSYAIKQIVH